MREGLKRICQSIEVARKLGLLQTRTHRLVWRRTRVTNSLGAQTFEKVAVLLTITLQVCRWRVNRRTACELGERGSERAESRANFCKRIDASFSPWLPFGIAAAEPTFDSGLHLILRTCSSSLLRHLCPQLAMSSACPMLQFLLLNNATGLPETESRNAAMTARARACESAQVFSKLRKMTSA